MSEPISVFYTPDMVADSQCMSPSAAKPAPVVESWLSKFDVRVVAPEPVTREDLIRVHDEKFVDGIISGEMENGFGNRSLEVAKTLLYTSGSMLSAAKHALQHRVAAAPCSGFHHAGPRKAEGFCTFNGLMVTAFALKNLGLVQRVGILDLDQHYGNGTYDILEETGSNSWIPHYTGGAHFRYPFQVNSFFEQLPGILKSFLGCDILLYQAGADPHVRDGGWMTTDQLHLRDQVVFDTLEDLGIPVAWNLAGGYQIESDGTIPKVLEIHDNTMKACCEAYSR